MTGTGFQINPEDFGPAGDRMDAAAADLRAQWQQLKAKSEAVQFGQYDLVGPLVQMTLLSAVAVADECFGSSGDALGEYAQGLRATGTPYLEAEEVNTQMSQG